MKEMKTEDDKNQMKELGRRFVVHLYMAIEKSNGDATSCKELAFSFFMHIQGIHHWPERKFAELIPVAQGTKVCAKFKTEKFAHITECLHVDNASNHPPISPNSKFYQKILGKF